jgi:ribosomal-protein-serine acetyltransferase
MRHGVWVRKSAQGRGIATETANAMVRYAFGALGMQRVGFTHSLGNEPSRRIAERLSFALEGIRRRANLLPGGRAVDRYCYARFDVTGLPELEVTWEGRRVEQTRQVHQPSDGSRANRNLPTENSHSE